MLDLLLPDSVTSGTVEQLGTDCLCLRGPPKSRYLSAGLRTPRRTHRDDRHHPLAPDPLSRLWGHGIWYRTPGGQTRLQLDEPGRNLDYQESMG